MNYKVQVQYRYIYANPFNCTVWLGDLLNKYETEREGRLEVWLNNDFNYDPLKVFEVTKLELNKDGKATLIKLTESGFSNG